MDAREYDRPGRPIWIDMDNSPHVVLFAPLVKELERRGFRVVITVRDCFQVCGLADRAGLPYRKVGRHYGRHKSLKLLGLFVRALQLVPHALRARPALALSHGSRSQMLVAAALRMPWVVMVDYEHVQLLPFVRATMILVPEMVPKAALRKYARRVCSYPGIKEDLYVPFFTPDPGLRKELGVGEDDVLAIVRPPATEAHYHNPAAEGLFDAVIEFLGGFSSVKTVVLARSDEQARQVRKSWPDLIACGRLMVPEEVLDGLNLIWNADLVVSGGGTMNREAAALGVPVYSIFRGKIGAVDRYLAEHGRLVLLNDEADVRSKVAVERRQVGPVPRCASPSLVHRVVDEVLSVIGMGTHGGSAARPAVEGATCKESAR
ncbi:MAG: DUF354 domain-containing protein [candidate division KSB1 bacterium]|nr:DUF354 domain-containing protein [candidate division KSB1 bacterium]MDZ7392158.1 DUF354 domain-containing protein [candidate division KSB1 bacterium]MDZ7413601.1 DUF354 domain-containing protein [candidate division KSB1 bacterium]